MQAQANPTRSHTQLESSFYRNLSELRQACSSFKAKQLRIAPNSPNIAGNILSTLYAEQEKHGISLGQTPAIVTNNNGEILSIVAGALPGDPRTPLVQALTAVSLSRRTCDLFNGGDHLYILGNNNDFDGVGAINSFAPSNVHIINTDRITRQQLLISGDDNFATSLSEKRKVNFTNHNIKLQRNLQISTSSQQSLVIHGFQNTDTLHYELNNLYLSTLRILPYKSDEQTMRILHELSYKNVRLSGGPFAAAIFDATGQPVSVGSNRVVARNDAMYHGEFSALMEFFDRHPNLLLNKNPLYGYTLWTSSAPCIACAETCVRLGLKTIMIGNTRETVEASTFFTEGPLKPRIYSIHDVMTSQIGPQVFDAFRLFMSTGKSYLVDATKQKAHTAPLPTTLDQFFQETTTRTTASDLILQGRVVSGAKKSIQESLLLLILGLNESKDNIKTAEYQIKLEYPQFKDIFKDEDEFGAFLTKEANRLLKKLKLNTFSVKIGDSSKLKVLVENDAGTTLSIPSRSLIITRGDD